MEGTKFRQRGIKLQKELGYLKRKNENNFFFKIIYLDIVTNK